MIFLLRERLQSVCGAGAQNGKASALKKGWLDADLLFSTARRDRAFDAIKHAKSV